MAAYRFFDTDSVYWQAIMAPYWQQTQQRMAALPVVLCLHDHDRTGLQRPRRVRPRFVELRSAARHVPASDLRGRARARAAGHH